MVKLALAVNNGIIIINEDGINFQHIKSGKSRGEGFLN